MIQGASDARNVLGVARDASLAEIKQAYRRQIAQAHPDRGGSARDAALLNEAYALLSAQRTGPSQPHPFESPRHHDSDELVIVDDDSLALVAPPDELFVRLLAAVERMGVITFVDEDSGYFEAVLTFTPPTSAASERAPLSCQLVASLQGRAAATEVFFSLETIDSGPAPALSDIVRSIATQLRRYQ